MSLEIKPLKCIALPVKLRSDTGTVIFGAQSFKSWKGQENLLLKNLQTENPHRKRPIFVMENIFCRKYGTNEMAFKGL